MYDYFEAFSIIPYRLATNGQFATTWTKKTPMHKRTVNDPTRPTSQPTGNSTHTFNQLIRTFNLPNYN